MEFERPEGQEGAKGLGDGKEWRVIFDSTQKPGWVAPEKAEYKRGYYTLDAAYGPIKGGAKDYRTGKIAVSVAMSISIREAIEGKKGQAHVISVRFLGNGEEQKKAKKWWDVKYIRSASNAQQKQLAV